MSEAKVCEVCGREPWKCGANATTAAAAGCFRLGYDREKARAVEAEARVAALEKALRDARRELTNYTRTEMGSPNTSALSAIDDIDAAMAGPTPHLDPQPAHRSHSDPGDPKKT